MRASSPSIAVKLWLSLAMMLLFIAALGVRNTGAVVHEWVGLSFCTLCILHTVINWRWYRNIHKGRYTLRRLINTALNFLLPTAMVTLCVTGIMNSRHIFAFLDLKDGMDIRQVHSSAAYWGIVLLGAHAGIQWVRVLAALKRASGVPRIIKKNITIQRGMALLLAVYGIWASFDRAMGSKLFLGFSFDFWDSSRPEILFYTHNFAILALYVSLTHYALKIFTRKKAAMAHGNAATQTKRL